MFGRSETHGVLKSFIQFKKVQKKTFFCFRHVAENLFQIAFFQTHCNAG